MTAALVLVLLCAATVCHAQLEDVADPVTGTPQFDALERYRDDPLCLPCQTPTQLTVLPGFSRVTAARVLAAMRGGLTTLDAIADSACLTIDQSIILFSCVTLDCSCEPLVESARLQQRMVAISGQPPDLNTRIDVSGPNGRLGGVYRRNADGTARVGWAQYRSTALQVAVGNASIFAGTGLVHGTAGGVGRSPIIRALDVRPELQLRPWTSIWTEGAHTGVAASATFPFAGLHTSAIAMWTQHSGYHAAVQTGNGSFTVGTTWQALPARTMASAFVHLSRTAWRCSAEIAADDSARVASTAIAHLTFERGHVIFGGRWFHPDMRNPYASAVSSRSSLGNEGGVFVGISARLPDRWRLEGSLDLHVIPSRSYGRPLPSRGIDIVVDAQRMATSRTIVDLRLRYESDDEGWRPPEQSRTVMFTRHRTTVRSVVGFAASRDVDVRIRIDLRRMWSDGSRAPEWGYLCGADVSWQPLRQVRFALSYITARAPSIESAAYSAIVPIPGAMRTIVGVGNGSWLMVGGRWTITPWSTLSAAILERSSITNGIERAGYAQVEFRLPR